MKSDSESHSIWGFVVRKVSLLVRSFVLLWGFLALMKRHRTRIVTLVVLTILSTGFGAVLPLVVRYLVDRVIPTQDWSMFWTVLAGYGCASLLFQVIGAWHGYISLCMQQEVNTRLSSMYFSSLLRAPLSEILDRQLGAHMFRATSDVPAVVGVVTSFLTDVVSNSLALCAAVGIMFRLQWQVTLAYTAFLPLSFLARMFVSLRLRPLQSEVRDHNETINGFLGQQISGVRVLKVFGREGVEARTYLRILRDNVRLNFRIWVRQLLLERIMWVFGSGAGMILQWWIWFLVMSRYTTLGSAMAISWYFGMIVRPFMALAGSGQNIIAGMVSGERVAQVLNGKKERLHVGTRVSVSAVRNGVSFRDVSFSYAGSRQVLSNVDFDLIPGEIVGLVGPSGSGKTTIINLLCGLYGGNSGEIRVGEIPLSAIAMASWRALISLAPQDPFLFDASIRENISYGNHTQPFSAVESAARLANIHGRILQLPQGYDTILSAGTSDLSGGERQRITIARALSRNAPIMVFDEAFSNLDGESEGRVLASLNSLKKERIIVVVSHRLHSLLSVDKMIVMENGRIAELASPRELLDRRGRLFQWLSTSETAPSDLLTTVGI